MIRARRRRGFSLVELMIVLAIAVIILGATWLVVSSVVSNDNALRSRVELQLQCSRALKEMSELLKQSGIIDTNTNWTSLAVANADADNEFPYIYPLGTAGGAAPPFPGIFLNNGRLAVFQTNATYQVDLPASIYTINTTKQVANTKAEEGLGDSRGILFRIAKDADMPLVNGRPDETKRTMAVNKGATVSSYEIQWGNEYHALTVVHNASTGYDELMHLVWDQNWDAKSRKVLATNVSRLIFETKGLPANPSPMWPLPSGRAKDTVETTAAYNNAMNYGGSTANAYPAPPSSPYEIRITLCLAKPDLSNPENSLTIAKRMSVVWQQANVIMRSIPH